MASEIYQKIIEFELKSGKMRWNEICNNILDVYIILFPPEKRQYTDMELWQVLFEPQIDKEAKKNKLENVMKDESQFLFFNTLVPLFLEDKFKEGFQLVKTMNFK